MVSVIIKRGAAERYSARDEEKGLGVIVCGYPPSASFRRRLVLPKMSMKELNEKLSVISRVVVHPKYRAVGLGSKLVHDTLSLAGTEYVEMSAVMAPSTTHSSKKPECGEYWSKGRRKRLRTS